MLHFIILTSGDIRSAAYFRYCNLSSSLIEFGHKVTVTVADTESNRESVDYLFNPMTEIFWYDSRKLKGALQVRNLLRHKSFDYVVQLNANMRSFINLALIKRVLIAEFDEPAVLRKEGLFKDFINRCLFNWLKRTANYRIVCAKELLKYVENASYVHHGNYVFDFEEKAINQNQYKDNEYFAYLGNFYPLWDHEKLLTGLHEAQKRGFSPTFIFIGSGPDLEFWKSYCEMHGLKNVKFTGFLEQHQWLPILRGAKALLFPMSDTDLNRCRCPSKIFAYLSAKRPIIAHKVGEISHLCLGAAKCLPPSEDLISYIEKFDNVDELTRNAKQFDSDHLHYTNITHRWLKSIQDNRGTH